MFVVTQKILATTPLSTFSWPKLSLKANKSKFLSIFRTLHAIRAFYKQFNFIMPMKKTKTVFWYITNRKQELAIYSYFHSFIYLVTSSYCVKVLVFSLIWLCDPMDCSPPGCSVHGILQARILEWVASLFSRGSSQLHCRWILYHLSPQGSSEATVHTLPIISRLTVWNYLIKIVDFQAYLLIFNVKYRKLLHYYFFYVISLSILVSLICFTVQ